MVYWWPWHRRHQGCGEWGGGFPLPNRLEGLGIVVSSPSGVRGGTPAKNDFTAFWACQNASRCNVCGKLTLFTADRWLRKNGFAQWVVEMDRMSDYDIQPKPKVWTGSPNECRTFGRTSAECCMLGWMSVTGDWWVHWTARKCRSKYYVSTWAHTHCLRWETRQIFHVISQWHLQLCDFWTAQFLILDCTKLLDCTLK